MYFPKATQMAHHLVGERLKEGQVAVDATAGNGNDTLFLARAVGASGTVYALDVQADALGSTAAALEEADVADRVRLVEACHSGLASIVPAEHHGEVAAAMFNLGYLPGGDHSVVTQPDSTVRAVQSALELLRSGGVLTVVGYPGHGGGAAETEAVKKLLYELSSDDWEVGEQSPPSVGEAGPRLFWAIRG